MSRLSKLKEALVQRRKGSLLVVIVFAALMAVVMVSMMMVASSLYSTGRDSSKTYGRIQTYRATTELLCYRYISDLEMAIVTRDLTGDWISVSGNAIYTQAIDAIFASMGTTAEPDVWNVHDATVALDSIDVSNPAILTGLLGELKGIRQDFTLTAVTPVMLDWQNEESWRRRDGAHVALKPVQIEVEFNARGEHLFETFQVNGLFLDVVVANRTQLTLSVAESMEGVSITRVSS